MEDQKMQQEIVQEKPSRVKLLWEKLRQDFQQGRFLEIGQKKMRESDKKRLIKKQRLIKYANIQERRQDVVFDCLQFINMLRKKLERDRQEQLQIEYLRNAQVQRPRNNQMINKYSQISQHQKETYDNNFEDFTEIENYIEFQQQKNILDRLEKKELCLLQGNEQNSSLSFSQSINLAFNSVAATQQKRVFPFENYIPTFKENDLNQLIIEDQCLEIDEEISNFKQQILCFTQHNDQMFGFALSNGIIIVKDIVSQKIYEVSCFANYCLNNKHAKAQDIVCLQFTPDFRHIMACHRTGAISMYDFKYNKMVYYIKNLFKYSSNEIEEMNQSNLLIIDFKVIAQISAKDEVYIIAINARGDSALIKIFKGFLSFEQQVVFLMQKQLFPITSINVLSKLMQQKYFQYDYDREDDFIVGLSSPEKLFIIRIRLQKMKAKPMFKYVEKMDTIIKKVKNSFLWSEIKVGKENQLMFLVSFTNFLYVGILSKHQEESIKDYGKMKIRNKYSFELKRRIRHYTSIKFIGALYKNIVLICDFNDQLFLINTTDFRSSFLKFISLVSISSFKMKLPQLEIKPTVYDLDSYQLKAQKTVKQQQELSIKQTAIKDQDQLIKSQSLKNSQSEVIINESKTQIIYSNSVSFSILLQKCYILLENNKSDSKRSQFACINLVSWRATLEELLKQGEYLNAMSFLHIIYSGYHKFAHNGLQKFDIKDLLVPQIERTALNYTDKLLKQLREEQVSQNFGQSAFSVKEEKAQSSHSSFASIQMVSNQSNQSAFCDIHFLPEHDRLIFAMEFLVNCQLQETIFYDIRQSCGKILGNMDFFIECLEPFILEGKITNIHNDVITDIIDYYQSRGNLRIIQQILTSLDLENLDIKPLVQLSMEKQLITALIYLSTRSTNPDFISPLMIFWNQFVASLRKWEEKNKGKQKSFIMDPSLLNPEEKAAAIYDPSSSLIREIDPEENDFLKEQLILSLLQDPLKIKCEYFGLRALWYFRLCIQQKLIDGEYINDNDYKQVVLTFESWISFPQNIKVCLQRWPQVFFQVLAVFFSEKPLKIIDEDQTKLKQILRDLNVQNLWEQTAEFCTNKKVFYSEVLLRQIIAITLEIDSQFNFVTRSTLPRNTYEDVTYIQKSINTDIDGSDEQDLTAYQLLVEKAHPSEFDGRLNLRRSNLLSSFYLFLANMIYQSQCSYSSNYLVGLFKFKKEKVVDIVFYLSQYPKTLDRLEFPQEELQKQAKIYSEGRDDKVDFRELSQLLRSEFLLSLIKYILDVIGKDNGQMQLLSQLLDLTEFATARSHILFLRGHYHRAIDSYIQSSNKTMSRLIFDWMWQNLTESRSEDPKKYEMLKDIMRVKLPDFIKIDSERTHQLFQKFLNDAEHDIISQLENNPNLQLLYIQNVIKQYKLKLKSNPQLIESLKVDKGILILNIKLMCQLNKPEDDVLNEITSLDFYPFEDILKICLEKQYLEVCTFIYLRMGLQEQALKSQIKMLDNSLYQYKKYLEDFYQRMQNMPTNTFINNPLNVFMSDLMGGRNQSTHFDNIENNEEGEIRQTGVSISIQRTESQTFNQSYNISDVNQMQMNANASNEKIQQFTKQINCRMQKMFDICTLHKQTDNSDSWFLLLDLLVQSCKKFPDIDTKDSLINLRKIFSQSIGSTIMQIADNVDMDRFLDKLRSSYSDISITDLKDTFRQLLQNSIDSYQVLYNCLIYIQQDLTNQMQSGSEKFLKGTFSFSHCSTCFDQLNSMDKVKRKIRKQIIQKSELQTSSSANSSLSTSVDDSSFIQNNEEDEDSGQIIIFNCGHSYHKECYFRQKNLRICLECIRAKNQLYFLIISRQDIDINKLNLFIRKQLELLQERLESNRRSSDLSLSRNNSYFETVKSVVEEETKEIQKFNKLRRIKKLKNFDKMIEQKYSLFEKDPVVKKQKYTS
ncbi:corvet complex core vacuolar protein (macronuclear) [Tetrahymena thermophila SB210]|uniref:Corvet complex core vacuolar protein n=1 Tax=Tetrahymena thermophila (strain SB210) TaxID=312017 RepID=I7MFX3_TETTS|nr:corvet complex core vacuolar protein [Tetrahymena thermophila SB210]EAR84461.2 corvet complex core vacuolar protein [Tetrahymena thermophila SB210]|eukprot:XP_001032124.2 corvet complex core vacuolar protein [Tetrahymena thermophila SB210]